MADTNQLENASVRPDTDLWDLIAGKVQISIKEPFKAKKVFLDYYIYLWKLVCL